ncbi:neurogenic locus notch homolog protein 1-like [Nematostella vectensis]|uniref:neurogenic locus notch homolog protein 1-like n=1 Tax=Nematostella vectensis TaxID=45351 RepID=UPI002076F99A|nr:neurogenic locus notch homolog protein 1-like [Nematostella vectensis]
MCFYYTVQNIQSYRTSRVTYYYYQCGILGLGRCQGSTTVYGTAYRTVYQLKYETKIFCCPGWKQFNISCPIEHNDCESCPCKNGGSCTDRFNDYTCKCQPGYTGKNCEIDIDECAGNPCKNKGKCIDHVNNYTCRCQAGVSGRNCEKVPTSCASIRALGFTISGVYRILASSGSSVSTYVYCDMITADGGWTMVFKVVSGQSPLTTVLWASNLTRDADSNALSVTKTNTSHYKSMIVEDWDAFGPNEVLVGAYVEGFSVFHMIFNAKKSDKMSWMQKSRVLSSPWTDPALSVAILEFTLKGICPDYPGVCQQFDVLQSGRKDCSFIANHKGIDVMAVYLR